jgi:hypothetical protein
MMTFATRLMAVLALAAAAVSATPAYAESSPCPGNMASYFNLKNGEMVKCTCPALAGGRTVWGTARYTIDSDVCRAAVHAGAAPAAGGEVTVYLAEGCPIFRSNAKNGVQSTNYGPYGRTFHFAKDAPDCDVQTKDDAVTADEAGAELALQMQRHAHEEHRHGLRRRPLHHRFQHLHRGAPRRRAAAGGRRGDDAHRRRLHALQRRRQERHHVARMGRLRDVLRLHESPARVSELNRRKVQWNPLPFPRLEFESRFR